MSKTTILSPEEKREQFLDGMLKIARVEFDQFCAGLWLSGLSRQEFRRIARKQWREVERDIKKIADQLYP